MAMWRGGKGKRFRFACVRRDTNLWLRPWWPSLHLPLRAAGHLASLASELQEQEETTKVVRELSSWSKPMAPNTEFSRPFFHRWQLAASPRILNTKRPQSLSAAVGC